MKTLIKIKYDKLKYTEYISHNGKETPFDFGYPLLNFINADIKETLNNSTDIVKTLEDLSQNDDYFLFNLFYAYKIKKWLQDSTLDNADIYRNIKIILDNIERKQFIFSTIINFCFLYNADKSSYDRSIDRFIFTCNKLSYTIKQPKYLFDIDISENTIYTSNLDENIFDKLEKEFIRYKAENKPLNSSNGFIYLCNDIDEFFSICMLTIFERNYIISRCQNCGKLFVPCKKNDALYCDRVSPQKENKTCKEYASKKPKGVQELYRKIYLKRFARYNRNKDNFTIKNEFESWKSTADKLKADLNKGLITDDEFEKWLLDNDK